MTLTETAARVLYELGFTPKDIEAAVTILELLKQGNEPDHIIAIFQHLLVKKGTSPFEVRVRDLLPLSAAEHVRNVASIFKMPIAKQLKKNALSEPSPLRFLSEFSGTPLLAYMNAPVPLDLGDRTNHMHVVGGSGAGKTTLLENLIRHDLSGPNSLIIVDSQRDLISKLATIDIGREVILVSPERYPSLNVFDLSRLERYSGADKEKVVAGAIQTFDYLFGSLLGADLTAKQSVFFRYVARLLLTLPETMGRNATILDMFRLMQDATPYRSAIAALPELQREFFERDFTSKTFAQTKEQIRYRLHALIENPTLARLFTSEKTDIDIFAAMNRGAIILVDTAKDYLKGSSAHFGQIFISLVLQATLERAAIPPNQRRPAYLYVDEAADYFDQNIDDLLTETRKYKLGCIFAHQYLDQCTSGLRASFAANCAIKFAGGLSTSDARALAPDFRTTPEFLLSQPPLHFAAFVRHHTTQAVSVHVKFGTLDNLPRRELPPPPPAPRSTPSRDEMSEDC